ncbi:MAG: dihydropteroate synthase, partial [Candidatus Hodgkinia cicadicola]
VGLNCVLVSEKIKQYALTLAKISKQLIWFYPNAVLPDEYGKSEKADEFAWKMKNLSNVANAIGACCGSSPDHIIKIKSLKLKNTTHCVNQNNNQDILVLSGMDALKINKNCFYKIGERTNVLGSIKFKKLILAKKYKDAIDIVKQQVINGAHIIDINMDDALINSEEELPKFIRLLNSTPELPRLPLMIDSTHWKTLLAGMKNTQGKCIINSISLKDGSELFSIKAQTIRMYGCIPVTVVFDETGQATSLEHRLIICKRAHSILTKLIGYSKEEIIFDLNTSSGKPEHARSIKLISCLFPNANFISGVSNLSSSKIEHENAGLNMGILNVVQGQGIQLNYKNLNTEMLDTCKSLILNTIFSMEEILTIFNSLYNSINYKLHDKNRINYFGRKLSITSNIKKLYNKNDIKIIDIKNIILENKIIKTMDLEKWISIKRNICIFKSKVVNKIILNSSGHLIGSINLPKHQINNEKYLNLIDLIGKKDFIHLNVYNCSLGIEATIIQRYFNYKGKLQCAAVFKSICDNLLEKCSKNIFNIIRNSQKDIEGERGDISPVPGLPICPDHNLKYVLSRILNYKVSNGLLTTKKYRSLIPKNSIITMFLEISSVYFENVGLDHSYVNCQGLMWI